MRAAYAATEYQVLDGTRWLGARIGRPTPEIDALLVRLDARSGTFVTAWNPRSEVTSATENAAAAERMAAEITTRGWFALPHRGVGDDAAWAPEEGWFLLDLDEATGHDLAVAYGQNAIVRVEVGGIARLVETHWLTRG